MKGQERRRATLNPGSELRVLLVEDNPDDALAVEESLSEPREQFAFDVTCVPSLAAVQQQVCRTSYHVVLCDLGLPDGRGLDSLVEVRCLVPNVPVVVMTGVDDGEVAIEAVRLGAGDYLVKGRTDLDTLGRILAQAVERHRLRNELEASLRRETFLATRDPLTRLANRHHFLELLEEAVSEERGGDQGFLGLLFLDLDRFKPVNDEHGHSVGDRLLQVLADRLRRSVRRTDTAARLGGDEFVVLLRNLNSPENAADAAHHILGRLRAPVGLDGKRIDVGISLGVALCPLHATDGGGLLQAADRAMYEAKARGGGVVLFDSQACHTASPSALADDLEEALRTDGLALHYQPVVDTGSEVVIGAEALLRWNHPREGTLFPETILPLAQSSGRLAEVGDWVLRSACHRLRSWSRGDRLPLAVNVSAPQILDRGFPNRLAALLTRTQIDSRQLIVEIPETGLDQHLDSVRRVLTELSALGVRIAVDDFGTGESSFRWLRWMPADLLKIDRSFVAGVASSTRDARIVGALVSMAHSLGMEVVAEGVERIDERDALVALDCHWMQGFLFGRPMPIETLDPLLDHRRRSAETGSRAGSWLRRRSGRNPTGAGPVVRQAVKDLE